MKAFLTHNPEDLEAYYGRALPELRAIVEVVVNPMTRDLTTPELIELASGCQVIVAHRSTPGESALFERSPELLAFLRCAVDISTIDLEAASSNGILVCQADKSFVASTAELALGLLLDLSRNISESVVDYRMGKAASQRSGRQLQGQTAGIIGYGSIGSYLANLLVGLGMEVLIHDPYRQLGSEGQANSNIAQVDLMELLARSDAVFPMAPASAETENMINAETLTAMKRGAKLVNVSRGELVVDQAVIAALDSGQLGGFAADVGRAADQRPSPSLTSRPGVVATPHLGGLTPENADAQAASSVEQVAAILAGAMPPRSVNSDSAHRLRSYQQR